MLPLSLRFLAKDLDPRAISMKSFGDRLDWEFWPFWGLALPLSKGRNGLLPLIKKGSSGKLVVPEKPFASLDFKVKGRFLMWNKFAKIQTEPCEMLAKHDSKTHGCLA